MSIDKTKLYMVYNYSSSPVGVQTRYESMIFDGANNGEPVGKPLSFDEIAFINSTSNVFKIGMLWFDSKYAKELNEELRNVNWEDVYTDQQIDDIILHPTTEKLQKILQIKSHQYFDRIRGRFTYLMNNGYDISNKVDSLIISRFNEFRKNIINSQLEVVAPTKPKDDKRIEELETQLKALTEKLEKSTSGTMDSASVPEEAPKKATVKKGRSAKEK